VSRVVGSAGQGAAAQSDPLKRSRMAVRRAVASSSLPRLRLRPMQAADAGGCAAIERTCYPEALWEGESLYTGWVSWRPSGCTVAEAPDGCVAGYVLCTPTRFDQCPLEVATGPSTAKDTLDSRATSAASEADTMYLHDMCVSFAYRGNGVGRLLMEKVEALAAKLGLVTITLTAVNGAWDHWERIGFVEVARVSTAAERLPREAAERLMHYPTEAGDCRLMRRAAVSAASSPMARIAL
jgi:GNAT superfamily N-acetyltransferase